jgi:hypothetical protein
VRSMRMRCIGALRPSVYGSVADILCNKGVRDDLISNTHSRMNEQEGVAALSGSRRAARGGTRGGSREFSLALPPIAPSP